MAFNLKGRSFLKLLDFDQRELRYLLDLSRDLKRAKYSGTEQQHLRGKNICLIFEKSSTRTMCAFEVAAMDQGAGVTYLGPSGSQIGHKESMKDTARVLGRMYDGIEYRGFGQDLVETLAEHAGVPVFNGLTDEFHPTQMLADLLTMQEYAEKPLHDISYAYVGDGRSNMGHSLMIAGCLMGMDVRIASPKELWPTDEFRGPAEEAAAKYGATLTITDDPAEAVKGVDFIHTDVWVSMGEADDVWEQRIKQLTPYQINADLMAASGKSSTRFMHCLPAFHNTETKVGQEIFEKFGISEMEVTEDVFESPAGIQFEQAENRMHTIKAVLVATLGR
ncbi:ornithine carbamoyltransferase [uncultured Tateyamaria sp.]|uniref:ornithine carbamoyltransferase n=1 Tax=uncultured Tateyamaria sp. TaxID=455651 RepID=UPI002613E017|nr:ornithine carbamoyltransferase [uncultured Tateyamaria sp.]